jgi:aspartyl/asparaginyl-tRNA synthetase
MKKWMKWLIGIIVILGIAAAFTYWYVTRQYNDTKTLKASYTNNANNIYTSLVSNDSLASLTIKDKIIEINGTISELNISDTTGAIIISDTSGFTQILCSLQNSELALAKTLKTGEAISIKGYCTSASLNKKQVKEIIVVNTDSLTSDDDFSMLGDDEPVEEPKANASTEKIKIENHIKIALIRSVIINNNKK